MPSARSTSKKTAARRKLWTAADLKQLKALAGRERLERIARQLRRTPAAVRRKATDRRISLAMK
jgi:hypothetical protein